MTVDLDAIKYNELGLIPAILQDAQKGTVLMMAWMNAESLSKTLETGEAWFYSRSRRELWHKGATSGNVQKVVSLYADCDNDTLLLKVNPAGPACHTGAVSCFEGAAIIGSDTLQKVFARVLDRKENPQDGSYTNYLFDKGLDKILKKVGEESSEVIIAAKNRDKEELTAESADLMYHMLVLLAEQGLTPGDVLTELEKRYNK